MNNYQRKYRFEFVFIIFILIIIALVVLNADKLMKRFYPFPHRELILTAGEQFDVDPYLVLAIIKTESKFIEEAVSPKGARGLMQVMPETGQWIAEQIKFENFNPDLLFDTEVNIMFGAWYLSYLSREFNNNMTVILAAYNAGPGKTKEWLTGGIWDGTINKVEDVPFSETRNYILKVTRYYRIYSDLYN